jgi:aspartate/methionine/tyrosine aminotransferase
MMIPKTNDPSRHARRLGSRLALDWGRAEPAPLAAEAEALRRAGRPPLDLVTAIPHEHGLVFPPGRLAAIVAEAAGRVGVYRPDPRGLVAAREAIAGYYARHGRAISPDRIVLTPGTSVAYFYALRLLVNPGQETLIPSPGYPLFDDLCAVAGAGMRQYYLACRDGAWRLDLEDIEFQVTPRSRVLMLVSPHNPTGAMVTAADYAALGAICRRHGLALVVDEVFCECLAPEAGPFARPRAEDFPLLITLNGFSKMLSLPGWKVGWMTVEGDAERVGPLLEALERMADAFLPVPDLQQAMIAPLLAAGQDEGVIAGLAAAYAERRRVALAALAEAGLEADACPAGVYLCGRLPGGGGADAPWGGHVSDSRPDRDSKPRVGLDDMAFAMAALRQAGVLVHPGAYYRLPGHWVMTCVAAPPLLREGIARLAGLARSFSGL